MRGPRRTRLAALAVLTALSLTVGCRSAIDTASIERPVPPRAERPKQLEFEATAYSLQGKTASGITVRKGIVAADPAVLPIGSRIRVSGAGAHSGEYVVADTGRSIKGREIDIYMPDQNEAVRFGRRSVRVEVLDRGRGRNDANVKQLAP